MTPAVLLLILRLLSAILLLIFFGVIGWLVYRDIKLQVSGSSAKSEVLGLLRVVINDAIPTLENLTFPLYAETWIGRSSSNAIVLDDAYTSNEHAVIRKKGGQWWLEDLSSRNGTLLNDMPLNAPAVVTTGDIFTIGQTSLLIDLEVSE
jgi:hypothetical protein